MSGEKSPFVAWHSARQDSTGRETSFCVVAYTGRFGGGVLTGQAQFKNGLNHFMTRPSGIVPAGSRQLWGTLDRKAGPPAQRTGS